MERRTFLRRGLFGGVLLGSAGLAALQFRPTRLAYRPTRALTCFDERGFSILASIASRTVVAPGADPVAIAHGVDQTIGLQCPEVQDDFRRLLLLFESAAAGLDR